MAAMAAILDFFWQFFFFSLEITQNTLKCENQQKTFFGQNGCHGGHFGFFGPIFELVRDFGVTNTCTKFEENLRTPSKVRALTRRAAGAGARDSIISSDYRRGYN